jgi:antitoxin component of MazEF toxin-antitoxin module
LALRIPHSFAVQAKVAEGTAVDIAVERDRLVVKPVQHQYRLRDLLKGIDRRNRHGEVRTGAAVGREIW